jgi:hypothetical protein
VGFHLSQWFCPMSEPPLMSLAICYMFTTSYIEDQVGDGVFDKVSLNFGFGACQDWLRTNN